MHSVVLVCSLWLFIEAFSSRVCCVVSCFFFQAEDGIRDLVRSRGLGDVYKRQVQGAADQQAPEIVEAFAEDRADGEGGEEAVDHGLSLIHI